jgi:microcystin-dependent protein
MAQHDYVIENQPFPSYRNDHNNSLSAIVSKNSGATSPLTPYAYQWWYDTSTDILKIRNADNDAWINFASFDQTNDNFSLTVQDLTVNGQGSIPSGTKMLFQQTTAPTGWTKQTDHNNKALRVVTGTAGTGGTNSFTNAFNSSKTVSGTTGASSVTITGSTASHTLTVSQIPAHTHTINEGRTQGDGGNLYASGDDTTGTAFTTQTSSSTGGSTGHSHNISLTSGSHTHSFSDTFNLDVQYVDLIIAQKD